MKRALIVPDELAILIRHLPPELKKKVRKALDEITVHPVAGKALVEELAGLHSFKLGNIRIVYPLRGDASAGPLATGPPNTPQ